MLVNPKEKEKWDATPVMEKSNAALGIVAENTFYSLGHHNACHGELLWGRIGWSQKAVKRGTLQEVWSKRMKLLPGAEEIDNIFYPWLMNESPWAKAFLQKDYKIAKKEGFSLDANLPADYVASACVATRWLTENYSGFSQWPTRRFSLYKRLLSEGVDLLWAFIMSNLFIPSKSLDYNFSVQDGHHVVPPAWTLDGLKKFVVGDYSKSQETFSEKGGYYTIDSAWVGKGTGERLKDLAKSWTGSSKTTIDYNLFRRPSSVGGYPQLNFKDLLNVMEHLKGLVSDQKS